MLDGGQLRSRGGIGVPQIVMDGLEMPEAFSGACIEREQAIRVEVVALPVAAVKLVLGGCGRQIRNAPLHIDREFTPHIDAAHDICRRLSARFRTRYSPGRGMVWNTHTSLPVSDIERANIARRREVAFAGRAAKNDQVFENAPGVLDPSGTDARSMPVFKSSFP